MSLEDVSHMDNKTIAVIGIGYVGLPLANEFSKKYKVIGYDLDIKKVGKLQNEIKNENLIFTSEVNLLSHCNVFIITVPTPIDINKKPDLSDLVHATKIVGSALKQNDIVIFESTVYPGCTEEECVPILELQSGLKYNQDFYCGYSPERINVGDQVNTLVNIVKITSGSTPEIAEEIDKLYASIILAGTYKAKSIKIAEAAKSIENAQRDLNISFVNELALIFDRMNIDTNDVIEAAATKWNFMKFQPGLVGGHCIGVDPYYLTYKAEQLGYKPEVILSGRRVNERMGSFVAEKMEELLKAKSKSIKKSKILILGITFKENCNDIRSTGVISLYKALIEKAAEVDVYDPNADKLNVEREYSLDLQTEISYHKKYDGIILAVAHDEFSYIDYERLKAEGAVIYDIKGVLSPLISDARL